MRHALRLAALLLIPILVSLAGCGDAPPASEATGEAPTEAAVETAAGEPQAPPVVEIVSRDYEFRAPSELPSGWNTLRMINEGEEPHFLVLWLLPEGKTFDDYIAQVYEPFMAEFARYQSGEVTRDEMLGSLGGALPEWLDLVRMGRGGVGLVSPGRTGVTSVELPPGDYVMECYMVTAEGEVHNQLGMLRPLTVTEEGTGASPPEADAEIVISNAAFAVSGNLGAGEKTIRVEVAEAPEGFLGHDIHLARLDEGTAVEEVAAWMDWIDHLNPPSPADWLGGAEQVPPGSASYLHVDLTPGRYAWISEGYGSQGLVQEFQIE